MARYGLKVSESDALGLIMDASEQLMKDFACKLIHQCRARLADTQPSMTLARAGDQISLATTKYVN